MHAVVTCSVNVTLGVHSTYSKSRVNVKFLNQVHARQVQRAPDFFKSPSCGYVCVCIFVCVCVHLRGHK